MYRIIDGRSSGKTSRLMLIAKENNALFVCSNPRAMETKARAYGIVGIDFINYVEYLHSLKGQGERKVVIDELEMFLSYATSYYGAKDKLLGYTISAED